MVGPLLSPPAPSRWSVKNRGVHCNLVLWLMRLSSVERTGCTTGFRPRRTLANGRLAENPRGARSLGSGSFESGFFSAALSHGSRAPYPNPPHVRISNCFSRLVHPCSSFPYSFDSSRRNDVFDSIHARSRYLELIREWHLYFFREIISLPERYRY